MRSGRRIRTIMSLVIVIIAAACASGAPVDEVAEQPSRSADQGPSAGPDDADEERDDDASGDHPGPGSDDDTPGAGGDDSGADHKNAETSPDDVVPDAGSPASVPAAPLADPPAPAGPVELSEQEVYPNAKALAADVAQTLTTYDVDDSPRNVAAEVASGASVEDVATAVAVLHHPDGWSRGEVVYPQLGGVSDDRASVMVVVERLIGDADGERSEVRTLDVRLRLEGDVWRFEELASVGGTPVDPPDEPSPEARAVLDDPRIELPDSARWDILAGDIEPSLLRLMSRAADVSPYGVVTLSTGHPFDVFGTGRQSDHTKGRAVDIYRVDDRLVVDDRTETSAGTRQFVEWFYDQPEVARLGSPCALDGYGGRSFTDVVHLDHLHVAVGVEEENE